MSIFCKVCLIVGRKYSFLLNNNKEIGLIYTEYLQKSVVKNM